MKLFCSLILLGLMFVGCDTSYDNKSLHCGVYTQSTCPASACTWSNEKKCVAYTQCLQIKNLVACTESAFSDKKCIWTITSADACVLNQSVICTLNAAKSACCAGTDTSCTNTDANCEFVLPVCNEKNPSKCSFNPKSNFCCSGEGANQTCFEKADNPNCHFVDTAGTCSST
ncbi:MAG: hypothetical protein WCK49_00545 [Myxococcaceae bacterium]